MTPTTDVDNRATPKQLAYLKSLATRTGQTFAWPRPEPRQVARSAA